jgi:hypothetical protein
MKEWTTLLTKRQLAHRAKMRARRGVRPWDHVNEDDAERSILRMRIMFKAKMTDSHIANALSLDVPLVQILRNKRHTQG